MTSDKDIESWLEDNYDADVDPVDFIGETSFVGARQKVATKFAKQLYQESVFEQREIQVEEEEELEFPFEDIFEEPTQFDEDDMFALLEDTYEIIEEAEAAGEIKVLKEESFFGRLGKGILRIFGRIFGV